MPYLILSSAFIDLNTTSINTFQLRTNASSGNTSVLKEMQIWEGPKLHYSSVFKHKTETTDCCGYRTCYSQRQLYKKNPPPFFFSQRTLFLCGPCSPTRQKLHLHPFTLNSVQHSPLALYLLVALWVLEASGLTPAVSDHPLPSRGVDVPTSGWAGACPLSCMPFAGW